MHRINHMTSVITASTYSHSLEVYCSTLGHQAASCVHGDSVRLLRCCCTSWNTLSGRLSTPSALLASLKEPIHSLKAACSKDAAMANSLPMSLPCSSTWPSATESLRTMVLKSNPRECGSSPLGTQTSYAGCQQQVCNTQQLASMHRPPYSLCASWWSSAYLRLLSCPVAGSQRQSRLCAALLHEEAPALELLSASLEVRRD